MKKINKLECKEISFKKFVKHINAHGFNYERETKGHVIFKRNGVTFTVPVHSIVHTGIIWQFNQLVKNDYKHIGIGC